MKTFLDYRNRYAAQAEFNGIKMQLIGGWIDLAAYYAGADGNAWKIQNGIFTNMGNMQEFIARINAGKVRGDLLPEFKIQPDQSPVEFLLYGLRKGDTEAWQEELLTATPDKARITQIKTLAARAGFHSFRVATFTPGEKPDFRNVLA